MEGGRLGGWGVGGGGGHQIADACPPSLNRACRRSGCSDYNNGVEWSVPFSGCERAGSSVCVGSRGRGPARPGDRRGHRSNPEVSAQMERKRDIKMTLKGIGGFKRVKRWFQSVATQTSETAI